MLDYRGDFFLSILLVRLSPKPVFWATFYDNDWFGFSCTIIITFFYHYVFYLAPEVPGNERVYISTREP
jgi:hypothetical protein